jgi:hypothetical protein
MDQDKIKGAEVIHSFDDIIAVNHIIAVAKDCMGVEKIHGMLT